MTNPQKRSEIIVAAAANIYYNESVKEVIIIESEYITVTTGKQKNIALIAHDSKKKEMADWVYENRDILKNHFLSGTGTTARLLTMKTGLPIREYKSGPLGGDQQIGARIVEGTIDFMVFFWDPLEAQPHDPDVKALLRIAVLYDIPVANNVATANFLLTSKYMSSEYTRRITQYSRTPEELIGLSEK